MQALRFSYHHFDAFRSAKRALAIGHQLARKVPHRYVKHSDRLHRALMGIYLQLTEGAFRDGADRHQCFLGARIECSEAVASVERLLLLDSVNESDVHELLVLLVVLDRHAGSLARLGVFRS